MLVPKLILYTQGIILDFNIPAWLQSINGPFWTLKKLQIYNSWGNSWSFNFSKGHYPMSLFITSFIISFRNICRPQWTRRLTRGPAAARMLGLRVRILPWAWLSLSCACFVLPGRGLCVRLITRPEDSCRVRCVWLWWWSLDNEEGLAH